jgi:hypothetical protein
MTKLVDHQLLVSRRSTPPTGAAGEIVIQMRSRKAPRARDCGKNWRADWCPWSWGYPAADEEFVGNFDIHNGLQTACNGQTADDKLALTGYLSCRILPAHDGRMRGKPPWESAQKTQHAPRFLIQCSKAGLEPDGSRRAKSVFLHPETKKPRGRVTPPVGR